MSDSDEALNFSGDETGTNLDFQSELTEIIKEGGGKILTADELKKSPKKAEKSKKKKEKKSKVKLVLVYSFSRRNGRFWP